MIREIIKELTDNPTPYSGKTDAEIVVLLKAVSIVSTRNAIGGSELFGYTDATEYTALTAGKKQQWLGLCGIDLITKDAVPLIKDIFPSGSATWGNIIKTETTTPFINVHEEEVRIARAN